MIIVKVIGGLGNQLFQYSLGRCLAERNRTRLKLDISAFTQYRSRSFALPHFAIEADVLTEEEVVRLGLGTSTKRMMRGSVARLFGKPSIPVVREKTFGFDAGVSTTRAPCYLEGYWQSPKYFAPIDEIIRKELTVRPLLAGQNKVCAERIKDTLAVSLHVRRGDYVSNEVTNKYHGVCGPTYFYACEDLLRRRLGEFTFFVFSDEPDWAERNLRFNCPAVFVSHNDVEHDYEDLRLMTLCRHHVIANSTFSWWGAWLCRHDDKIVIAPRQWFGEAGHSTEDLLPAEWIRL